MQITLINLLEIKDLFKFSERRFESMSSRRGKNELSLPSKVFLLPLKNVAAPELLTYIQKLQADQGSY